MDIKVGDSSGNFYFGRATPVNEQSLSSTKTNTETAPSTEMAHSTEAALSIRVPSTIVDISDQGLALVKQAIQESIADTYVEKTDEEYANMSFEALIDERNGGKNANHSLDKPNAKGFRFFGKADQAATAKLAQQSWENGVAGQLLTKSLKAFKDDIAKAIPDTKNHDFDISMVDGKATVVSKNLSKDVIAKIQKMLDDKNSSTAINLKRDIATYNNAALKMINMQIYDEKGTFGDKNSPYVHREEPLSLKEFTQGISYNTVAASGGGTTYQKYLDIIGSTKYGVKYVYKNN